MPSHNASEHSPARTPAEQAVAAVTQGSLDTLLRAYMTRILSAPVYDVAIETPLHAAPVLSAALGNQVLLKREDLQPVFSFKLRGAYTRLSRLSPEQRAAGVIAASAGNHAQGLALAAQKLGVKCQVVMPVTTPEVKIEGVRSRGGEAILHGDGFPQALAHALNLAEIHGYTFVPPFDDPDVIAGQGTVAMEMLRQHQGRLDAIFVPVGGGSLIAGVAAYVKYLRPDVRIIGVEPHDSNCLQQALAAGEPVVLSEVGLFADGVAVARIGEHNFELCQHLVDEVITVSADEICAAIKDVYGETRAICEPAGALAVAGLKRYVARDGRRGEVLVAINSGANINFSRLRHVAERAALGEGREALLAVTLEERPGSLRAFCEVLGKRQITEFNYRCQGRTHGQIFLGVQTDPALAPRAALLAQLAEHGYPVLDMTDNELAKLHLRHTVGGRAPAGMQERLYRLTFPERPGALGAFLNALDPRLNITLFHYRNHGADAGRVLLGLELGEGCDAQAIDQLLSDCGCPFTDESDNPAYRLFIG